MKRVYLIGFRGTSFRDEQFKGEPTLIRAGHVGMAFEGDEARILGFHPTPEAIAQVGGEEAAIEWLKEHNTLPAALQDDTMIFYRADELAQAGARTAVWQLTIPLENEQWERMRKQTFQWYNEAITFTYVFPTPDEVMPPDRDNCATFPRRLGLPLPEVTGQLFYYMQALERAGERWIPPNKEM